MNEDQQLEERLTQLGRRMAVDDGFAARVMQEVEGKSRWRSADWRMTTVAVAAMVMLLIGGGVLMIHVRNGGLVRVPADGPQTTPVQYERSSTRFQTLTERPVILEGDVPAREIEQQEYERLRWIDPVSHASYERVVPRDHATLVTMETY